MSAGRAKAFIETRACLSSEHLPPSQSPEFAPQNADQLAPSLSGLDVLRSREQPSFRVRLHIRNIDSRRVADAASQTGLSLSGGKRKDSNDRHSARDGLL